MISTSVGKLVILLPYIYIKLHQLSLLVPEVSWGILVCWEQPGVHHPNYHQIHWYGDGCDGVKKPWFFTAKKKHVGLPCALVVQSATRQVPRGRVGELRVRQDAASNAMENGEVGVSENWEDP